MTASPKAVPSAPQAASQTLDSVQVVERLTSIALALSLEQNLDVLLERILEEAKNMAHADGGTLYRLTENNQLEFSIIRCDSLGIAYGGSTADPSPLPPIDLYIPGTDRPNKLIQAVHAVLDKETVNIPDVYNAGGYDFEATRRFDDRENYRTRSVITIPMINHKDEVLGCLQLVNAMGANGESIPFSPEVQKLVEALASQAAVILDNRQLIEAQEQLFESFIRGLARAIDAHSIDSHRGERVPALTEMLADAACTIDHGPFRDFILSPQERHELRVAAWLHECGKIGAPSHLTNKGTRLTGFLDRIELLKTRWEVLKRDAQIALLKNLAEPGANANALNKQYLDQIAALEEEFKFLTQANSGSSLSEADVDRLQQIGARNWKCNGNDAPVLTTDELYNLSTRDGTLNPKDRSVMGEHMLHTHHMLEALPFPRHLQHVPEYACGYQKHAGSSDPLPDTMSIPARMMALAEVFESLTANDRPYTKPKKLSEVMREIGEMKRARKLDPNVVDLFVRSQIYLQYAERFINPAFVDQVDEKAILSI